MRNAYADCRFLFKVFQHFEAKEAKYEAGGKLRGTFFSDESTTRRLDITFDASMGNMPREVVFWEPLSADQPAGTPTGKKASEDGEPKKKIRERIDTRWAALRIYAGKSGRRIKKRGEILFWKKLSPDLES